MPFLTLCFCMSIMAGYILQSDPDLNQHFSPCSRSTEDVQLNNFRACVILILYTSTQKHSCPKEQGITDRSSISLHNCQSDWDIFPSDTPPVWFPRRRNQGLSVSTHRCTLAFILPWACGCKHCTSDFFSLGNEQVVYHRDRFLKNLGDYVEK